MPDHRPDVNRTPARQPAGQSVKPLPVLDANVTAGMCLTTMRALGRDSVLVGSRGTIVGVVRREALAALANHPGAANRPLRDACESSGLVWL